MAKLIRTTAWLDAWVEAAEFLLIGGPMLNLVLEIAEPDRHRIDAHQRLDEFFAREKQQPMNTVAETVFPGSEYRSRGLQGVYEVYPEETFPAIKRHPKIPWGTYAYRLVRRKTANGKDMNPLKQMIDKMNMELATVGTMRSCFEIDRRAPPTGLFKQVAAYRIVEFPCDRHAETSDQHLPCLDFVRRS